MARLILVALSCCLVASSISAARPPSPFGLTLPPRGGAGALSDFAGLCEAVKSTIVEKAGQSVSLFHGYIMNMRCMGASGSSLHFSSHIYN